MYKLTEFQIAVLKEVNMRSGIEIYTEYYGYLGCYQIEIPGIQEEKIFFHPRLREDRSNEIMFHELAHATGTRLNRNMNPITGRDLEEVIAEKAAMMCLYYFGMLDIPTEVQCEEYINSHSFTLSDAQLRHAGIKAEEAANYILNTWLPDLCRNHMEKAS